MAKRRKLPNAKDWTGLALEICEQMDSQLDRLDDLTQMLAVELEKAGSRSAAAAQADAPITADGAKGTEQTPDSRAPGSRIVQQGRRGAVTKEGCTHDRRKQTAFSPRALPV